MGTISTEPTAWTMQDKNFELLDLLMRSCTNGAMSHDPSQLYDSLLQLTITIRPYVQDKQWNELRERMEKCGKSLLHDEPVRDTPGQRKRYTYTQNKVYAELIVLQGDVYKVMTPIIRMMMKKNQGMDDLYRQMGVEKKDKGVELNG